MMADDIVKRLSVMKFGDEIMLQDERAIHAAVAEIERLRALVTSLQRQVLDAEVRRGH